jgi:hypothetical protein
VRNEDMLGVKEERNVLQTIKGRKEGRLTGLVTCCLGIAFQNTLLKEG